MEPAQRRIEIFMIHSWPINKSPRPDGFTKEKCLKNLLETMDKNTNLTIFFDGDPNSRPSNIDGQGPHFVTKYPISIVCLTDGKSVARSFRGLFNYVNSLPLDPEIIVYILEDDFTHLPGWPAIMREGFGPLEPPQLKVDYVTLYDHPDKYFLPQYIGLQSQVGHTASVHWRTVPSTVNTVACLFKTFRQDYHIHNKFLALGESGRTLVSPLPGYSTHTQSDGMAPCVDWSHISTNNLQKQAVEIIKQNFIKECNSGGDIYEHLPTLYKYAKECLHITECGVRGVVSSYAFAYGLLDVKDKPRKDVKLIGVDLDTNDRVATFTTQTSDVGINYVFYKMSDLESPMEPTDLLFIDTWHIYGHLKRELARWNTQARKYIILHDTTVDGIYGETIRMNMDANKQQKESGYPMEEILKGLWPAVEEFLVEHPEWKLRERYTNCNGLTVLERLRW